MNRHLLSGSNWKMRDLQFKIHKQWNMKLCFVPQQKVHSHHFSYTFRFSKGFQTTTALFPELQLWLVFVLVPLGSNRHQILQVQKHGLNGYQ